MRILTEQNRIIDQILQERLDDILPAIMQETGTEFWIIASREYNEDPMFRHLVPANYPTARRLTILLLICHDNKTERISLSFPDRALDRFYQNDWDRKNETQFEALTRLLNRYDPQTVTVNVSDHYAYTDGLSHGLYELFRKELPEKYIARFVSSDTAGIRLLETRTKTELEYYPEAMEIAMGVIRKAFSEEVIQPGVTTCRDVMNFMADEVNRIGLTTWFDPDINLQNENGMLEEDTVIQRGDLVHCDFGISYLHMHTDTQRLCYIAKKGEKELPEELKKGLLHANRFQDIVCENLKTGRTGNEVFLASVQQAKEEGIDPRLYTHPLGLFGHACGPTIGLWTNQNPIYPAGENMVHDDTSYALESSVVEYLEMYGRETYIFTEESVVYTGGKVHLLAEGRDEITVLYAENNECA